MKGFIDDYNKLIDELQKKTSEKNIENMNH
ncbi:hypothetical protein JTT01_07210 [Clostridium botulinum]|nr:hypothetical protein [Clostridium botulinum]